MRGSVYCRSGTDVVGRKIMEAHLRACMYAGLRVTGINLECLPGMIEFQVGPLEGVLTADHTWMARYILIRMCEEFGVAGWLRCACAWQCGRRPSEGCATG
jgi:glutamine synthetase